MPLITHTRRAAAQSVTGLFGPTPTPGSDVNAKRQQYGWGYSGLPVSAVAPYELAVSQRKCAASLLTAVHPVTYNPGSGNASAFRQQAGWGYCGLPITLVTPSTAEVPRLPFVYRRRMNRLRARKR